MQLGLLAAIIVASSPKSQLGSFRQNAPRMLALMLRSIRSATRVQVLPPAKRAAMRLEA
jgi:hypothetical protein